VGFLSWILGSEGAPPIGPISPLAWAIIGALSTTLMSVTTALWVRGNKIADRYYADLKACNEKRNQSEEDVLGLLKVLRLQMEASRGGRKG
jgi:hypothetical protein